MNTSASLVFLASVFILSVQAATCPKYTYETDGSGNSLSKDIAYYASGAQGKVSFITNAVCRVKETTLNPTPVSGTFTFVADPGNPTVDSGDGQTTLNTIYSITGLTDGDHKYHVHNLGDVYAPDGSTVENHFVGSTSLRPAGGPQEVGLLNQGTPVQNTDGNSATGSFPDHAADLTGHNSITGRAIIIHGNGGPDPLAKAAQCVIGLTGIDTSATYTETNTITRAAANLEKVGSPGLNGEVIFQVNEWGTVDVKVFGSGFQVSTNFYLTINDKGDITLNNGASMGAVYQGIVRYPINGGRSLIGQVGATTSTTATISSDANGVIHDTLVDWEVDLNGLNSVIGRGLLLRRASDNAVAAQAVIGISRDSTYSPPASPVGLPFSNSIPAVLEAQAVLTATAGSTTFRDGIVQFKRLPESDPLYPGVRVRYHIVLTTPRTNHTLTIRSRGEFAGIASQDISANGVFTGFFSGRESIYNQVGMVGDGVALVANDYGVLSGEFVDRSLWLGDYNSIIGRHIALSTAGSTNLNLALAVGVIGRTLSSITTRDYPAPVVTDAECVFTGPTATGTISLHQQTPTSPVQMTYSVTGATGLAFGVAPAGDIFGDTTAGYLFADTGVRYFSPSCPRAYAGALGDFGGSQYTNISLSGPDSIIGRTLFVAVDGSYTKSSPGGGNPVLGTQSRAGQCVVGIVTETSVAPSGTGIRFLPSVYSAPPVNPPTVTGAINGASSAIVSLAALLCSVVALVLVL